MRRLLLILTPILFCWPAVAVEIDAETDEAATPWTSLAANDAAEDFHFVLVSDRTGGERPGVFQSALPKVNLLGPAFVVSVGDLIEGYTEDEAQIEAEWREFEGFVETLEAPFFYVAGNHDMNNVVMAEAWRARFGPTYYHFTYKGVLFLVLNSELFGMVSQPNAALPGPWTQDDQLAFIDATLDEHADARWTIVVVHQPLWEYRDERLAGWETVETMLGDRDYTVFAGHHHRYVQHLRNDRRLITLATTGGGSSLRGTPYGEFDHVAWVTMTADGPRIANLELGGIHAGDMMTVMRRDAVRTLSTAVRPVLAFGDGGTFEEGMVAFEVANRGRTSMDVSYNVDSGPHLSYAGAPQPMTLAPGQDVRVSLELAANAIPYWRIAPGVVEWSLATTPLGGDAPVRLKSRSALLPVGRLELPSDAVPTTDGDLNDWPELPHIVNAQGNVTSPATLQTDISFRFGVREAGGDLYFAAQVTDDDVVASSDLGPRVQDAIVLNVDSRPEPQRSANVPLYPATRDGHIARMARAHLTVVPAKPAPSSGYLRQSEADVTWAVRRTPTGYNVEAQVPGDFLDAQAGGEWRDVRIGVTAVDWDSHEIENQISWETRGSSGVALHWQPDRFGEAPVAGTGTFVRQ